MKIPNNLDECFEELTAFLSLNERTRMKESSEDDLCLYHHGIGRWMRNNWKLWEGGVLKDYFQSLGLSHPDDMSGVIIQSYHNHLNNRPNDLDDQIKQYLDFWAKNP